MCSWSSDPAVTGTGCFNASAHQGNYNVETTVNTVTTSYDYPELNNTTSNDEDDIIAAAVAAVADKYILASDLNIKIAEEEEMTIISVRSADVYADGHIPGAINIAMDDLLDNLDQIDPDAPVYLYCYTGHNAGQAVAILNLLGYDAYSLKYGYCSWSPDNALYCYDASADQSDYEVEQ
jgi:rhodanese-related sulfurtransferase